MQVWEVTAQLIGLAGSVGLLKAIEATGKPENVLYVWGVNQVFLHNRLDLNTWLLAMRSGPMAGIHYHRSMRNITLSAAQTYLLASMLDKFSS